MIDIAPKLLSLIENEFDEKMLDSDTIKNAIKLLRNNQATYSSANDFAIEVGKILADAFKNNITPGILPNGKMYYNIADRIVRPTMTKNHELVSGYSADVQSILNRNAGLKIKGVKAELDKDKINGIINRIASEENFEDIEWILDAPIKNYTQNIVDKSVKANVDFHAKAGLEPKVIRTSTGKCCSWCDNLAGAYTYPDVPTDVYRRHDRCRCTVTYKPAKGRTSTIHSGNEGKRRYAKDQYGDYKLTKEARIKRSEDMAKGQKERDKLARQKRMDTWAQKKDLVGK